MAELTVDRTYGTALFEAAADLGKKEQFLEEADGLLSLLENEPEFKDFISHPSISNRDKKDVLEKIFADRISEEFLNFLYVLVDKGRTVHLEGILKMYKKLIMEESGYTDGVVYSVVPLGESRMSELEEEVSKLLRTKVRLANELDPKLIGGIKILAEGKLLDLSIRKRFDDLESQIMLEGGK